MSEGEQRPTEESGNSGGAVAGPSSDLIDAPASDPPLSKNALKKKLKKEAWEASRPERQAQSRERRKRQRENQRAKKAEQKADPSSHPGPPPRVKRRIFGADVVIDCAFDEGMTEREIISMCQQLSFCYASNKRSPAPFRSLIFTGPSIKSGLQHEGEEGRKAREPNASAKTDGYLDRLEKAQASGQTVPFSSSRTGQQMDKTGDAHWRRWKNVEIVPEGGLESLWSNGRKSKADFIYLTADTEETIATLQEDKTYIIGGLVDRNRYKNVCLDRARELGLQVARLPIDPANLTKKTAEGKQLNSRKVLTVNQVVDILLGWTEQWREGDQENKQPSWEEALERGLPGRKFESKAGGTGEGSAKRELEEGDAEEEVEQRQSKEPRGEE